MLQNSTVCVVAAVDAGQINVEYQSSEYKRVWANELEDFSSSSPAISLSFFLLSPSLFRLIQPLTLHFSNAFLQIPTEQAFINK